MNDLVGGSTIQERLRRRLVDHPEGRAVAFYKAGRPVDWQSYRDFHDRALSVAGMLSEEGLKQGDVCLIVLPSGEQAALTLTGVLLMGAHPLLLAPPTLLGPNSDLSRVLMFAIERTKAPVTVVSKALEGQVAPLVRELERATALVYAEAGAPSAELTLEPVEGIAPEDVAALQFTSGTTGLPKICVWSQRAVISAIDGMAEAMELSSRDVCFNWTPLYHDMGLVNNFLTCLTLGIPVVLMSPHDFVKRPADWLVGLNETGATVTWAPNFGFALAAQRSQPAALEGVDLSRVRGFWNAAERIHARTFEEFGAAFSRLGVKPEALRANFGCAENIGGATFTPPGESYRVEYVNADRLWDQGVAVPVDPDSPRALAVVGCGRGHSQLRVRILDEDDNELPDGSVGRVALRTPSRMDGYLGDERATAQAIVGDLLITGDIGYLRAGELFWVGRSQERITVRGKKFDPSDFEPILLDVPGLREGCFAAFGIPDPENGTESVVIVSELRDSATDNSDEIKTEIERQVSTRLGLSLGDVVLVPPGTLTKTSSGKRRHRHFRRLYEQGALGPQTNEFLE